MKNIARSIRDEGMYKYVVPNCDLRDSDKERK